MKIEGEIDEAKYRLTFQLLEGEIEGETVEVGLNADSEAVVVLFPGEDESVLYDMQDMIADAYEMVFGKGGYATGESEDELLEQAKHNLKEALERARSGDPYEEAVDYVEQGLWRIQDVMDKRGSE